MPPAVRPAPTGRVVQQVPNAQELNQKIRQLLATHITQGVQRATEEAKKAVERQLSSPTLMSDLAAQAQRSLEEQTPELVEKIKARVQEQVLASLGPQLAEIGEGVRKDVTEQALDAMKVNAPRMGEAAFPRVVELMKQWLDSESDLGGKLAQAPTPVGEDPGANAELLAELDSRLRSLEATRRRSESEEGYTDSLAERVAELEASLAGVASGAADVALSSIEERLAALEGIPRVSPAVAASLDTDPLENDPGQLDELEERLSTLECDRGEFADQVAEEVASMGDRVFALEKDVRATREAFEEISRRLERIVARTEELAARPIAAPRGPSEVPSTIDLKDLSERVAILAVGPLMQAIDGRLEELDLEGLPERVAETVVPRATRRVLERLGQEDDLLEEGEGGGPAALQSDSGYLDEDFARFRRERLEGQGRRPKPDDLGYLTESDAGRLDAHAPPPAEAPEEELDAYASRERLLKEHAAQWARQQEEAAREESDEAETEGAEPNDPPPVLPQRLPPGPGEEF